MSDKETVTTIKNISILPDMLDAAIGFVIVVAVFWWTDVEISFTKDDEVGIYMEFGPDNVFRDD